MKTQNIHPHPWKCTLVAYKDLGTWFFDDAEAKLVKEPFDYGVAEIIELVAADLDHPNTGFQLWLSDAPFSGSTLELSRLRMQWGDYLYCETRLGMEGCFCPALFRYPRHAPEWLYAGAAELVPRRTYRAELWTATRQSLLGNRNESGASLAECFLAPNSPSEIPSRDRIE